MTARSMSKGAAIFVALLVIVVLVLLTLFELWAAQKMGFDVIAHLQVSKKEGGTQFFFEAFGFVAFILVQPVVLVWLLRKMVHDFTDTLAASFTTWFR